MNLKKLTTRFLTVLSIAVFSALNISCEDTETTNTTGCAVYYYGVTDIGPSMSYTINAPTYAGGIPSDFSITGITCNGESCSTESFIIDSNTGTIEITNTKDLAVGLYSLSIGCHFNGSYHEFKDAVSVNMLAPIPDGVKVEPDYIKIDFEEVNESKATAKVTTEGEHVSIKKYEIAQGSNSEFFNISQTGIISINPEKVNNMQPGIYPVSLKLETFAGYGIFENAVTFNITSKPLGLTYNKDNSGIIEEETEASGKTHFTSEEPILKGSLEGIVYSIEKITPETDKIKIDPSTGVLSVDENHGLLHDTQYIIDIRVANEYAPEGVVIESAFTLSVLEYIAPIENFAYANVERVQYTSISAEPDQALIGDAIKFSFVNPDKAWKDQLTIDSETGKITASKEHTIPLGTYPITVQATNNKGSKEATFNLVIKENPNDIKYIYYGNNLGLDKTKEASQYRVKSADEWTGLELKPEINLDPKVIDITWEIVSKRNISDDDVTIDKTTGEITLLQGYKDNNCMALLIIEATAGTGEAQRKFKVPVAFHMNGNTLTNKVTIEYTPFVFKVNPREGGTSATPILTGVTDKSKFLLDYRRSFYYINMYGPTSHKSVTINNANPPVEGFFMNQVWRNYYGNQVPKYGDKGPMSYYKNKTDLTKTLGYVIPGTFEVKINANKWYGDSKLSKEGEAPADSYANGLMSGEMTFTQDGNENNINSGKTITPIFIWFDEKF